MTPVEIGRNESGLLGSTPRPIRAGRHVLVIPRHHQHGAGAERRTGVLAAIAVPTLLKVISNSKDGGATETANSLSYEAGGVWSIEGGVKGVDCARGAGQPVAITARGTGQRGSWAREMGAGHGAIELGVAEGGDTAI
jgi:hypothetical protein